MTNDEELEKKYQAFLQREESKKSPPIPLKDKITELTPEMIEPKLIEAIERKRAADITQQLKETTKKNLLDAFHIDLQIAGIHDKGIAANKKLRYDFARDFISRHWSACVAAGLRIKDLTNV